MSILWFNNREIKEILKMRETIEVVEEAFRQHGLKRVQMPAKIYLNFQRYHGDLRAMPAYIEALDTAGVKIVNAHPNNPNQGLPTVMAIFVLNDPKTGTPIAIMDGTHLTDMRTGAGGAIAVKYLARKDSRVVGMVGAGCQARSQLQGIKEVIDIEEVKVASKTMEGSRKFKKDMERFVDCEIKTSTIEEACKCDVLVTTTPVTKPIVKKDWVLEGTHINAIGADAKSKEELEPEILKRARIVVDDASQACHSGEVNVPISKGIISKEDIYCELGEIIAGKKVGRKSSKEITIFDSTGLAIQDVATAKLIYEKAREGGLGKELEFLRK